MKRKRMILSALAISMVCTVPIQAAQVSADMAVIEVDGKLHQLPAYLIEGNYYFKLREVAGMMQGTHGAFRVDWNSQQSSIVITSGVETKEEKTSAVFDRASYDAVPSSAPVFIDGSYVNLKAYNIGDYTYFKLRDLGETLGFEIGWRERDKRVLISTEADTSKAISPWEYQRMLGKGMDVDWSKTKGGRENYSEQTVEDFAAAGISHVRIRISEDADEALLELLDQQIGDCLKHGVIPVIAYQADNFKNNPNQKNMDKAVQWWGTVAERYQDISPLLSFNLLIEATDALNKQPDALNEYFEKATAEIRKTNPERILIISPRLRSDAAYLEELEIPSQSNGYLMAEWHFYAAGPSKTNERKLWTTGTKTEKALIQEKIDLALAWQKKTGIPTWVGAWMPGNYNDGDDYTIEEQSVFAEYMRESLEQAGIPFAVNSDTKFYDREENKWIANMQPIFQKIFGK